MTNDVEAVREADSFGRQLERYVVVAWLREQSNTARYKDQRSAAWEFADAIESGQHLQEKTDG